MKTPVLNVNVLLQSVRGCGWYNRNMANVRPSSLEKVQQCSIMENCVIMGTYKVSIVVSIVKKKKASTTDAASTGAC